MTGNSEPHMWMYSVPVSWTRAGTGERDKQQLDSEGVATSADVEHVKSMRKVQDASDSCVSGGKNLEVRLHRQTTEARGPQPCFTFAPSPVEIAEAGLATWTSSTWR